MTQAELVTAIGDTLTRLDNALMDPDLISQQAKWQQSYAMRKHLDDQQRMLVAAAIKADDVEFQTLTGKIQMALGQLKEVIDNLKKIDKIINIIGQVSADLDVILKTAG